LPGKSFTICLGRLHNIAELSQNPVWGLTPCLAQTFCFWAILGFGASRRLSSTFPVRSTLQASFFCRLRLKNFARTMASDEQFPPRRSLFRFGLLLFIWNVHSLS
jgi:hypothetical protein